jgi:hypothetical protein
MQRDRSLGGQVALRQQGFRCGGPFPSSTSAVRSGVEGGRGAKSAVARSRNRIGDDDARSILAPQSEHTMSEFITPSSMLPSTRKAAPSPPAPGLLHWLRRHVIGIVVLLALLSAVVSVAA